jgi:hypothetical protein
MPNWFKKIRDESPYASYYAELYATISVPKIPKNPIQEEDSARYILKEYLPKDNDASKNTGVVSYVDLEIGDISKVNG